MRLLLFVLASASSLAKSIHYTNTPYKIKESLQGPPRGWRKHGPAAPDDILELKIALRQPHFHILENHLWEVSNPKHERYGSHLSKEETEALMAPHPETLDAVGDWLSSHNIEEEHLYRSSAQDWVTIHAPVAVAEIMLNTTYDVYTHSDSGEKIIRTMSYSLPAVLLEHVDFVQPTTMFTRPRPFRSTFRWSNATQSGSLIPSTSKLTGPAGNQVDSNCNGTNTITCLRQLYNAVGYNTSATNGNTIAITGYLGQYVNNQDLQQFFQLENPMAYGSNYTFVSVNGGINNQSLVAAGNEANLDAQFTFGLTYPTPATFYSTGGAPPFFTDTRTTSDTNEPYLDWLDYVLHQERLPQTISTSYGDDEQTVPYSYAKRVCDGFAALGARGVSVVFSSGDGGVGDNDPNPATQICFSNDGTNKTIFLPQFPASCPFVTSVGGTNYIPETAANLSGGGFSNYFPRPAYQDKSINKYLKTLVPGTYDGLYNSTGRGIPDVAAQAWNFEIVYQGETDYVGGTSCASPTFAAFVSMLNDARITAGKPPLGFLNPWLYETGHCGLNDITVGNNPGCGTQGFNATVGWDPVTGHGTPNFRRLLELAMAC